MITESQLKSAEEIIKQYEEQINKERQDRFRQSLMEYDETFWAYRKAMQTIYISAILEDNRLVVTQFIKHTNGIVEIKTFHSDRQMMESLLRTLSEYRNDDWEHEDEPYLFEKISGEAFRNVIEKEFFIEMKLSDNFHLSFAGGSSDE